VSGLAGKDSGAVSSARCNPTPVDDQVRVDLTRLDHLVDRDELVRAVRAQPRSGRERASMMARAFSTSSIPAADHPSIRCGSRCSGPPGVGPSPPWPSGRRTTLSSPGPPANSLARRYCRWRAGRRPASTGQGCAQPKRGCVLEPGCRKRRERSANEPRPAHPGSFGRRPSLEVGAG
jgi:hypothetical protein